MDIRQSPQYARFLTKIGWQVKKIDNWNIFIRKIPFYGKIAKLQKIVPPINFDELDEFIKKEKIRRLIVEPDTEENSILKAQFLANDYQINSSPFIPTKTIQIDLTKSENDIFKGFSEAKRRAIRKALKSGVEVEESTNIKAFIKLKTKNLFPIGFLMQKEIRSLWQTFYPNYATLLLASASHLPGVSPSHLEGEREQNAGILLLFWNNKAYYWLATSNKEGNKYVAPSLLVWEALKISKKRGCKFFDFEGVYDYRFHDSTKNWKGFTKFKEGFAGKEITYIGSYKI